MSVFGPHVIFSMANFPSSITDLGIATTTYEVSIQFQTDGTVDVIKQVNSDDLDVETYVMPGSFSDQLHVRCLFNSGDNMTGGDAEDVWHALTSARSFIMTHVSAGGDDQISGNFDFSISRDGGSTILEEQTGVTVNVGEVS